MRRLQSSPVAPPEPIHLRPTAALAERVLLPGDPGRALALAQALLAEPRMFNHHRGLWGYTGAANADGAPLTIQSTGMGGPSAAIVLQELIALGARRAIRVGTCGAIDGGLELGDLVVVREAICADGASRALGAGERIAADRALADALEHGARGGPHDPRAVRAGAVVSTDLFYEPPGGGPSGGGRENGWSAAGALAVEMEAAALFAVGAGAGIPVACVLTVSDTFSADGVRTRIDDDVMLEAAEAMGARAVAALAG